MHDRAFLDNLRNCRNFLSNQATAVSFYILCNKLFTEYPTFEAIYSELMTGLLRKNNNKKLRGLSPQANYTDRATTDCP
jgi:hypothetical protein